MLGKTLDRKYRVRRLLGQGGMGAVYEAVNVDTGRRVALKVITGDLAATKDVLARFRREARAAAAIESQHVVQIFDSGTDRSEGIPFMVMEFLDGEDLQHLVKRLGPLPPDLAMRIAAQACTGLVSAHKAGVVHRDIKPGNLFLSRRDGELIVRVLDFGIAKVKMDHMSNTGDRGLTRTGGMLGSPLYMSPEQAQGLKTIDHRTDVWSMGAVLHEALTGQTPHHAVESFGALILAICSEPPAPVQQLAPWLPPEVAEVVHRALRLNPNERFQTVTEMLDALRALLPGGSSLTESMLVPLSDAAKRCIAPRLSIPAPKSGGSPALTATASIQVLPSPSPSPGTTAEPVTSVRATKASSKATKISGLVSIAALIVGGAWFLSHSPERITHPPPPADDEVGKRTPGSAIPLAATVAPEVTPVSAPDVRTSRVQIVPPIAAVEVDGSDTRVEGGLVEIHGPIGSVHSIRVTASGQSRTEQIVIKESGAVPSRVEIEVAVPKLSARTPLKVREPTVQPAVATPTHVVPVSSAPKPVKPSAPALEKTFE